MTASVLKACAISVCCMSMSLSCCACVRVMTAVIVLVRRLVEVRMAAAGRKILARFTRLRIAVELKVFEWCDRGSHRRLNTRSPKPWTSEEANL